jgi:hypothetical protein
MILFVASIRKGIIIIENVAEDGHRNGSSYFLAPPQGVEQSRMGSVPRGALLPAQGRRAEGTQAPTQIYFMAQNIDHSVGSSKGRSNDPEIDSYCCRSRKYEISYLNKPIADESTYYFKAYLDLFLLEKVEVFITVDLLFGLNFQSVRNCRLRNSEHRTLSKPKFKKQATCLITCRCVSIPTAL